MNKSIPSNLTGLIYVKELHLCGIYDPHSRQHERQYNDAGIEFHQKKQDFQEFPKVLTL